MKYINRTNLRVVGQGTQEERNDEKGKEMKGACSKERWSASLTASRAIVSLKTHYVF